MSTIEQHNEVVSGLQPFIKENLSILKPAEKLWHPADLLPDPTSATFIDEVIELRKNASRLSDDLIITLVGNTITEEALATYSALLNRIEPLKDPTGTDQEPFSKWIRGWVAEEHRHEIVMDRYLLLSGRVRMKPTDIATHGLLNNGFDPGVNGDPYKAFAYTSFQEGATELAHKRTGRKAKSEGDLTLFKICGNVAGDENRHERFYSKVMGEIFRRDPAGAMTAFAELVEEDFQMPAALMVNFEPYAAIAQRCGIYTTKDYVELIMGLMDQWKISDLDLPEDVSQLRKNIIDKYTPEYAERGYNTMMKKVSRMKIPQFDWVKPAT